MENETFDVKVVTLMTELKDFKKNKPDNVAKISIILDSLSKIKECGDLVSLVNFGYPTRIVFLGDTRKKKIGIGYCDQLYKNDTSKAALVDVSSEEEKGKRKYTYMSLEEVAEKIGCADLEKMASKVLDEQIAHYRKLNNKPPSDVAISELQAKAQQISDTQAAEHSKPDSQVG